MTFVWILVILQAFWFGFELGRKWTAGVKEAELEEIMEHRQTSGIKLHRIAIRR